MSAQPPRIRTGELPRVLVTGGAGCVGVNVATRLLDAGICVRVLDSLLRKGSEHNIHWLGARYAGQFDFVRGDVRDADVIGDALAGVVHVVHLAARSEGPLDPVEDFEVNVRGTLTVLEAVRAAPRPPSLVYASTSELYRAVPDAELRVAGRRYAPANAQLRALGIPESWPLEPHGPHACSKAAAEHYVLDYARSFGLRTVVLRLGSFYGPHQHDDRERAWVLHLLRAVQAGRPVTIRGDGLQVRDLLYVDDLVEAFEQARLHADVLRGRVFNVGGGADNAVSVLELLDEMSQATGRCAQPVFDRWLAGGSRYDVSDLACFAAATGWQPRTGIAEGLRRLLEWVEQDAFQDVVRDSRNSRVAVGASGLRQ